MSRDVFPHSGHDFWGKLWGNRGTILGVANFRGNPLRQATKTTVEQSNGSKRSYLPRDVFPHSGHDFGVIGALGLRFSGVIGARFGVANFRGNPRRQATETTHWNNNSQTVPNARTCPGTYPRTRGTILG